MVKPGGHGVLSIFAKVSVMVCLGAYDGKPVATREVRPSPAGAESLRSRFS